MCVYSLSYFIINYIYIYIIIYLYKLFSIDSTMSNIGLNIYIYIYIYIYIKLINITCISSYIKTRFIIIIEILQIIATFYKYFINI